MSSGIHIVDGVLSSAQSLRERVLGLEFSRPGALGGSGLAWCAAIDPAPEDLLRALEKVWDSPLECVHATARYTLAASEAPAAQRRICHSDHAVSELTAVLYLSRPQDCRGGTRFFRHRPTGAVALERPLHDDVDFFNAADWETTLDADMDFNRLVTYPSAYFHALRRPLFGTARENGRLVLGLRLNRKRG